MRVKMSKQPPPAPTTSAVGPCPTVIQIVGRPGTGSFPCAIAPPDHPEERKKETFSAKQLCRFDLQLAETHMEHQREREGVGGGGN